MILNLSLAIIESSLPKLNKLSSELFCLRITPDLFWFESFDLKFPKSSNSLQTVQLETELEQDSTSRDYVRTGRVSFGLRLWRLEEKQSQRNI